MEKYITKPVVIEAAEWKGKNLDDVIEFCKENDIKPYFKYGTLKGMTGMIIPTLEGDHVALKGDFIIRGLKGEYYPCKPETFHPKYKKEK